jgi:uncharacterized membrane protein YeaQ/YmgE (transglycosylase-associated protein family)
MAEGRDTALDDEPRTHQGVIADLAGTCGAVESAVAAPTLTRLRALPAHSTTRRVQLRAWWCPGRPESRDALECGGKAEGRDTAFGLKNGEAPEREPPIELGPVRARVRAMMTQSSSHPGIAWLLFSLLTVVSWGVYGVFLHTGQVAMQDPVNGRYKAFLFVGIAYFLTAVLAPLALLLANGASLTTMPARGMGWSLVAGIVGAVGAFGVLLAFGAKGTPAVVMSIVFAGAPVVNAIYSLILHPPAGGWGGVKPQFYLGIVLAALGGCLVTFYKPAPPASKPQAAVPIPVAAESRAK